LGHRLVEQVLLRVDVGVKRSLLDTHRPGEVADRGAVVALLSEETRGLPGQLRAARRHAVTLTIVRSWISASETSSSTSRAEARPRLTTGCRTSTAPS